MVPQRRRPFTADLDALTARAAARMWNVYPGYSQDRFPYAELEPSVRGNLELAVRVLQRGTGPLPAELGGARDLGARRAGQGVPLESIIQAYRQTERVIVLDVLHQSRRWPVAEAEGVTDLVITTFDDLTDAMINAYRDTSSAIEVERRRVENEVVTALAGGIDVGAARLEQWVRALDLDPGGVWIAAAVRSTERSSLTALQVSLRRRAAGLGGSGISHVLFGETDRVLLILVSVAGDEDRARDAVRTLFSGARPGGPVLGGVGDPCRTLGEAGSSCRQAQDAMRVARSADPGDPVTLVDHRDVLVDVLVDAHPGAADALTRAVLDPLARYPYLVETLEVLLAHHLSQSVTARELFLHVNTVSHRLHRIHQLTGRHPTRFPDAVEIALALRWRRLRTGPDDGGTATGGPGS